MKNINIHVSNGTKVNSVKFSFGDPLVEAMVLTHIAAAFPYRHNMSLTINGIQRDDCAKAIPTTVSALARAANLSGYIVAAVTCDTDLKYNEDNNFYKKELGLFYDYSTVAMGFLSPVSVPLSVELFGDSILNILDSKKFKATIPYICGVYGLHFEINTIYLLLKSQSLKVCSYFEVNPCGCSLDEGFMVAGIVENKGGFHWVYALMADGRDIGKADYFDANINGEMPVIYSEVFASKVVAENNLMANVDSGKLSPRLNDYDNIANDMCCDDIDGHLSIIAEKLVANAVETGNDDYTNFDEDQPIIFADKDELNAFKNHPVNRDITLVDFYNS